jgi:glycosyltransferase involved in cell wall biosynthesis
MKNVSLIIPAKNEKESLYRTLSEVKKLKFIDEIIIIVDNKDDNSIKMDNINQLCNDSYFDDWHKRIVKNDFVKFCTKYKF